MDIFPARMDFPATTLTGKGTVSQLIPGCARFGNRGVVVHGGAVHRSGTMDRILSGTTPDTAVVPFQFQGGEPCLHHVEELLGVIRQADAQWVAGIGGGSVLDLAKAGAALAGAGASAREYHDGLEVETRGLPFAAVPTTAGTGSEATRVSVLTNAESGVKKSFRSEFMMARLVVLDPGLLAGSPAEVIANAGMDALTQGIESYISSGASRFSEVLALQGVELVLDNLVAAYESHGERGAEPLLQGSYLTGIAFSLSRLGVVHGLAHPLGARYRVPHGQVCALCLPHAIRFNRGAMGTKYAVLSRVAGGDLLERVKTLLHHFKIRNVFADSRPPERSSLIREVLASGSTAHNPRTVTSADVNTLLAEVFGPQ